MIIIFIFLLILGIAGGGTVQNCWLVNNCKYSPKRKALIPKGEMPANEKILAYIPMVNCCLIIKAFFSDEPIKLWLVRIMTALSYILLAIRIILITLTIVQHDNVALLTAIRMPFLLSVYGFVASMILLWAVYMLTMMLVYNYYGGFSVVATITAFVIPFLTLPLLGNVVYRKQSNYMRDIYERRRFGNAEA